jgi:hypothetical protein
MYPHARLVLKGMDRLYPSRELLLKSMQTLSARDRQRVLDRMTNLEARCRTAAWQDCTRLRIATCHRRNRPTGIGGGGLRTLHYLHSRRF